MPTFNAVVFARYTWCCCMQTLSEVIVPAGAKMMMAPLWAHYAEIAFGKGLKARVAVAL